MSEQPSFDELLLSKFFFGETDEIENKAIYEWINTSSENKKEFARWKQLFENISGSQSLSDEKVEKDFKYVQCRLRTPRTKRFPSDLLFARFLQVAAALLILIAVSYITFISPQSKQNQTTVPQQVSMMVPKGQQGQAKLPDGTLIWINAGSTLSYSIHQSEKVREVFLQGEAYFEVARDKKRPFIVHTADAHIKVLGTKFNVMSYDDDDVMETTVVEGCVTVAKKNNGEMPVQLVGNRKATLEKEKRQLQVQDVDASLSKAWKDGSLVFREESLPEIVKKLERRFDVKIVLQSDELKGYQYTATFEKDKPLKEILAILKQSAPICYTINKETITIEKL